MLKNTNGATNGATEMTDQQMREAIRQMLKDWEASSAQQRQQSLKAAGEKVSK